jgi:hypothetical protein
VELIRIEEGGSTRKLTYRSAVQIIGRQPREIEP